MRTTNWLYNQQQSTSESLTIKIFSDKFWIVKRVKDPQFVCTTKYNGVNEMKQVKGIKADTLPHAYTQFNV